MKTIRFLLMIFLMGQLQLQAQNDKTNKTIQKAAVIGTAAAGLGSAIFGKKKDKNPDDGKNNPKPETNKDLSNGYPEFSTSDKYTYIVENLFGCKWKTDGLMHEGNNEVEQYCIWQPSKEEENHIKAKNEYAVIEANFATKIDTVLTYTIGQSRNFIVITSSLNYSNKGILSTCHACAPTLGIIHLNTVDNKKLTVNHLDKIVGQYGAWGKLADVSLLKLDDENIFYQVDTYYSGQGESFHTTILINQLGKESLVFTKSSGNGATGREDIYDQEATLTVDKKAKKITINSITKFYKNNKKTGETKETEYYTYDKGEITRQKF